MKKLILLSTIALFFTGCVGKKAEKFYLSNVYDGWVEYNHPEDTYLAWDLTPSPKYPKGKAYNIRFIYGIPFKEIDQASTVDATEYKKFQFDSIANEEANRKAREFSGTYLEGDNYKQSTEENTSMYGKDGEEESVSSEDDFHGSVEDANSNENENYNANTNGGTQNKYKMQLDSVMKAQEEQIKRNKEEYERQQAEKNGGR